MTEMPSFKGLICKGCYALGTACGRCEKCEWEKANLRPFKHDTVNIQRDKEVERILAMSDEEIMVEAIREYGSPAAASKAAERIREGIMNTIKLWRLDRFLKEDGDGR